MQVGDTNRQGNTLILGGWNSDLFRTKTGRFITGVQVLDSEEEAINAYNGLNGTSLPTDYISSWFQPWYEETKGVNKEYKVPSRSHPGEYYRVNIDPLGNYFCNCPGFMYRNECWHIDAIKELTK